MDTKIKRFLNRVTPAGDHLTEHPEGDWIDYADHCAAVAQLVDDNAALVSALTRLRTSYKSILASRPVRDVEETLAEVGHALKEKTS